MKSCSDNLPVNKNRHKDKGIEIQWNIWQKDSEKKVKMVSVQTIATIVVKTFKIVSDFSLFFWDGFAESVTDTTMGKWFGPTWLRYGVIYIANRLNSKLS